MYIHVYMYIYIYIYIYGAGALRDLGVFKTQRIVKPINYINETMLDHNIGGIGATSHLELLSLSQDKTNANLLWFFMVLFVFHSVFDVFYLNQCALKHFLGFNIKFMAPLHIGS